MTLETGASLGGGGRLVHLTKNLCGVTHFFYFLKRHLIALEIIVNNLDFNARFVFMYLGNCRFTLINSIFEDL